jgi:hypothetical protein
VNWLNFLSLTEKVFFQSWTLFLMDLSSDFGLDCLSCWGNVSMLVGDYSRSLFPNSYSVLVLILP